MHFRPSSQTFMHLSKKNNFSFCCFIERIIQHKQVYSLATLFDLIWLLNSSQDSLDLFHSYTTKGEMQRPFWLKQVVAMLLYFTPLRIHTCTGSLVTLISISWQNVCIEKAVCQRSQLSFVKP